MRETLGLATMQIAIFTELLDELALAHVEYIFILKLVMENSSSIQLSPLVSHPYSRSHTIDPRQTLEYFGTVSNATNEKLFAEMKKRISKAPYEEIVLTVSSTGGPTGAAMCFYDTMRHILRPNLTTIGTGDVDSSGVIVFLAGTRRIISPRTTLLLHEAGRRFDPHQRFTASEIEAMAKEDRLKDEQYASVVAENSLGLSAADAREMMRNNTILTANDLVRFGLAHELLS